MSRFREIYLEECKAHALQRVDTDPVGAITGMVRQLAPLYGMPPIRLAAASGLFQVESRHQVRTWVEAFH